MAKFFDTNQLSPPTAPGIDPNNEVQRRLIEGQKDYTISLLRGELASLRGSLEAAQKELVKYRLVELHLGENDHSEVTELEDSLRELADLFASKYSDEDHPRVQKLIRMFTRPIEDKMREVDEQAPVVPPIR